VIEELAAAERWTIADNLQPSVSSAAYPARHATYKSRGGGGGAIIYQAEYVDLSVRLNGAVLYRALRSRRTTVILFRAFVGSFSREFCIEILWGKHLPSGATWREVILLKIRHPRRSEGALRATRARRLESEAKKTARGKSSADVSVGGMARMQVDWGFDFGTCRLILRIEAGAINSAGKGNRFLINAEKAFAGISFHTRSVRRV